MYRGSVNDVPNRSVNDIPRIRERCTERHVAPGAGDVNDVPNGQRPLPRTRENRERCTEPGTAPPAGRDVNDVPIRTRHRRPDGDGEGPFRPCRLGRGSWCRGVPGPAAPRAGANVKAERERSTESARAAGGGGVNEVPNQAASVASSSGATRERGQNAIRMRSLLAQRRVSTPSSSSNSRACGSKLIVM